MTQTQIDKKRRGKCILPSCSKNRAPARNICYMHYSRRIKIMNTTCYVYNNLKQNAKRRGKEFNLTLPEFREWIATTNYMELRGKTSTSLSIDRKKNHIGYQIGNLQIITFGNNVRKQHIEAKIEKYEAEHQAPMTFNPEYL